MSLRCLAILGNKNEPLYICASGPTDEGNDHNTNDENNVPAISQQAENNVFGFFENDEDDRDDGDDDVLKQEASKSGFIKRPASIRHEVRIRITICISTINDVTEKVIGAIVIACILHIYAVDE